MSWNWKDIDEMEQKEYPDHEITISSREYRDLIAQVYRLKTDGQREHDDWYKENRRADALNKELEEIKEDYEELKAFIDEKKLDTDFKLWKVESLEKEKKS